MENDKLIISMVETKKTKSDNEIEHKTDDVNDIAINMKEENSSHDTNESDPATSNISSLTFKKQVIKKYIRPNIEEDIRKSFDGRNTWAIVASVTSAIAELFGIAATVLSFVASSYDSKLVAFIAGLVGILMISLNRFGTYATGQAVRKTEQINEILHSIGVKESIPDIFDNVDETINK